MRDDDEVTIKTTNERTNVVQNRRTYDNVKNNKVKGQNEIVTSNCVLKLISTLVGNICLVRASTIYI